MTTTKAYPSYPSLRQPSTQCHETRHVTPYDNSQTGHEKWYVQHDGREVVIYNITFTPDGKGGTKFSVHRER